MKKPRAVANIIKITPTIEPKTKPNVSKAQKIVKGLAVNSRKASRNFSKPIEAYLNQISAIKLLSKIKQAIKV